MTVFVQFLTALLGVFVISSLSTHGVSFLKIKLGYNENRVWDKDFKPTFLALFIPNLIVIIAVFFII